MEQQPRKRDADRSRGEILDAAERLFAARGYDAVTMADIGAAAGLSRGTPGYFFGQKEQLYGVVLKRAAATFRMFGEALRLREAAGPRDRDTVVRDTVTAFVALLVARRDAVHLLDRDGGATVGSPHVTAVDEALSTLGPDRGPIALTIATLAWYPVAHPEAAAAAGVDSSAPGFAATWTEHIIALVGGSPAVASPAAAEPSRRESVRLAQPPPQAPTPADPPPAEDPHARFVSEVVGDKKRKKGKKKKRDKGA